MIVFLAIAVYLAYASVGRLWPFDGLAEDPIQQEEQHQVYP